MEKQGSVYINKEERMNMWCFCYCVFWKQKHMVERRDWYQKDFCNLKEAKAFAKKMWKEHRNSELKPYIIEMIVPCQFFKEELFSKLKKVDIEKYRYDYTRRVW